jgi:hypothetical protein
VDALPAYCRCERARRVSRTSSTSSNPFLDYREDIQTIVEATTQLWTLASFPSQSCDPFH